MVTQHRVLLLCAILAGVTVLAAAPGASEEDSGPGYACGETQPLDDIALAQVNAAQPEVWFEDEETHQGTARYLIASKPSPVHVVVWTYRWESWGAYKCLGATCDADTSPSGPGTLICEGSAARARYIGITYLPNEQGHANVLLARL